MGKSKTPRKPIKESHRRSRKGSNQKKPPPSWEVMKNILTCKHLQVEQNQKQQQKQKQDEEKSKSKKMRSTMVEPAASSPEPHSSRRKSSTSPPSTCSSSSVNNSGGAALALALAMSSSSSSCNNNSKNPENAPGCGGPSKGAKGMGLRRLSGCYECRMVVDPVLGFTRDPSLRATIRSCPQCGDIFMKPELLEVHQAMRHAVSELGAEDTSKKIVEIIFQSSWVRKKQVCKIERILKVENTERTVNRFEEYRKSIKAKAASAAEKKQPRCIADGNELLRFHCTTLMCSLGLNSTSNLCNSLPRCNVCSIIRDGFKAGRPVLTTASSGHAHDQHHALDARRAMLVCRVIAGRVNNLPLHEPSPTALDDYDSAAGLPGLYSTLEELYVYNPKAILPCFVVIYTGF